MIPTLAGIGLLVGVIIIIVALARRPHRLPGKISGFRYELEGARVVEDNVLRRTWIVPVVVTNSRRVPATAPQMHGVATVHTGRRTRVLRRPYMHNGVFQWDTAVPSGEFNPDATFTAHVRVELPVDESPRRITIARFANGNRGAAYAGRVVVADAATSTMGAS